MSKRKKYKKGLIILASIVGVLALFFFLVNIIPPRKAFKDNLFINENSDIPMLAAHRGGSLNNPENTLKAYKAAVNNYHIDIIESDLWMTKDGYLVYSHDGYIDRMSDVQLFDDSTNKHYIADYTLEELKNFNFGYNFEDKNGNRPYENLVSVDQANRQEVLKANDLQILEVEELFNEFYETNPTLMFIVEIKNGGEEGMKAADILNNLLTSYFPKYKSRVVIGTFHDEISKYLKETHPTLLRGASVGDAAGFILTQLFGVNLLCKADFACLQIPTSFNIKVTKLKLDRKTIIKRAHQRGIAVQFWTINDRDEMEHLAKLGADCIMTDDPELFNEVFGR